PKILYLDEPTLGLDVLARRELWNVIKSLKGSVTIVLTTHYMEEVEALSDHVAVMMTGAVKAYGTVEELKAETGKDTLEEAFIAIADRERGIQTIGYEEGME
ncbi:MAG: ABC transporter ATP-binding protein, partial [Lachnospiraceae bacterium]|nr:ABC transporter ATP-binding protein [Lachnospiraceae bacterium]